MNGDYLLDTSILVEIFAGDKGVIKYLEDVENTFIPSIAICELHYGARKSARAKENIEQVEQLVLTGVVLPCDGETGYWYGIVKDRLRRIGKPIPENTGNQGTARVSYVWDFSMGDMINALIEAGLTIEFLHEFPYAARAKFPFMEQGEDGW